MTKDEIHQQIVQILSETFDIPADKVTLDADLGSDLDIDSIDAVDLMVQMKQVTGRRLEPEAFKAVRTVSDVVDAIHTQLQE